MRVIYTMTIKDLARLEKIRDELFKKCGVCDEIQALTYFIQDIQGWE